MSAHLLIIDESDAVRSGLRLLLGNVPAIATIHDAANTAQALDLVRLHPPTLVVLDPYFGDGLSMHIVQRIKRLAPSAQIAILTLQTDPAYRQFCLALGADWFFDKASETEQLLIWVQQFASAKPVDISEKSFPSRAPPKYPAVEVLQNR